ncbi:MAG: murein biosynthesis integral membrane protein MurJ [Acidobacteria bacterium]|nr:MAG: murein biosynthesis integral membrane protein MurJ [Acidobacteriota bacterium]
MEKFFFENNKSMDSPSTCEHVSVKRLPLFSADIVCLTQFQDSYKISERSLLYLMITGTNMIHRLKKQTLLLILTTIGSRLFGLMRTQVISFLLGTSRSADVWGIAFLFPNLFRRLIAEGSMSSAFIPFLSSFKTKEERKRRARFLFSSVGMLSLILILLLIILIPELLPWLLHGTPLSQSDFATSETVFLTRLMLPFVFFVCLSALCQSLLNIEDAFFLPASTPILLSLCIIFSGLISWHFQLNILVGLALGVLIGGFVQFFVQWLALFRKEFVLFPNSFNLPKDVRKTLLLWLPTTVSAGIYQLNILLCLTFSFNLFNGAVASLNYSLRLTELILGVFAASTSTALLPTLTKQEVKSDLNQLHRYTFSSLTDLTFIALPASLGLILSGYPLIEFLFVHGEFNSWSQMLTYGALLIFALTLLPLSWYRILSQVFYALGKIRILVTISCLTTIINVTGLCILPNLFPPETNHLGIALSLLIYSWILFFTVYLYCKKLTGMKLSASQALEFIKIIAASCLIVPLWFPFKMANSSFGYWLLRVLLSILVYTSASYLMKTRALLSVLAISKLRK